MYSRTLQVIAGLVAGLVMAEGAVRLCTHPSIDYASIFRPGPYCQDAEIGLTSACPDWSGFMSTSGRKRYVPLRLNSLGYRGPFESSGPKNGRRKVVVIVGGQSQGFGFGLRDRETYPFVAAKVGACGDFEVHNVSFVGLATALSWRFFEREVLSRHNPDHVLLAIYWREARADPAAEVREYAANARRHGYAYGWRFSTPPWLPDFGRASHALLRVSDRWFPTPPPKTPMAPALSPEVVRGYEDRVRKWDAAFSVLILPWGAPTQDKLFKEQLRDLRIVDTHEGLVAADLHHQVDFQEDGHYAPKQAEVIGRMLAKEICEVNFPG